jgi:hypothetical protein
VKQYNNYAFSGGENTVIAVRTRFDIKKLRILSVHGICVLGLAKWTAIISLNSYFHADAEFPGQ